MTEERLIRSTEENRAMLVHNAVQSAGDMFEMVDSTVSDVRAFMASDRTGDIISEQSREFAQLAGWSPQVPEVLAGSLIAHDGSAFSWREGYTGLRLNIGLLSEGASRREIEDEVTRALTSDPDALNFYSYLFRQNPIIGTTTAILRNHAAQMSDTSIDTIFTLPFEQWYAETFTKLVDTYGNINQFFSTIRDRIPVSDQVARSFVTNWQRESSLPLAEILNIANCMAVHAQVGDCGVYVTHMPTHGNEFERTRRSGAIQDLWRPPVLPDGRESVYVRYQKSLGDYNNSHPTNPLIPIFLHVSDVVDYTTFLDSYWQQIQDGISSRRGTRIDRQYPGTSIIRLGNSAEVLIRPVATTQAQARIAMEGTGFLTGFNYRIDQDRFGKIGTDFGGITDDLMLAYAQEVKDKDMNFPTMMTYQNLVDDKGRLRIQKRGIPTIMRSDAYTLNNGSQQALTTGNKAALVAAVAMQEGSGVGLRHKNYFTYHSYEYMQDPAFSANFAGIARSFHAALLKR